MNRIGHYLGLNYTFSAISVVISLMTYRYVSLNFSSAEASFFYFAMLVVMVSSAFELGFSRGIVTLLGERKWTFDSVAAVSIIGGLVLGLVGGAVVSLAIELFTFDVVDALVSDYSLTLASIVAISIFNIIQIAFIDNTKKFILGFALKIVNQILFLLVVFLVRNDAQLSLYSMMLITKIFAFTLTCASMAKYHSLFDLDRITFSNILRRLIGYLGWSSVSTFSGITVNSVDRLFILNQFSGSSSYNNYSLIADNTLKGVSITAILASSILPFLNDDNAPRIKSIVWVILIILSVGILILIIFSRYILQLWLGDSYEGLMNSIFVALVPGLIFTGFGQQFLASLQGRGLVKGPAIMHFGVGVIYVLFLYSSIEFLSLVHIAVLWSVRAFIDMVILALIHRYHENKNVCTSIQS